MAITHKVFTSRNNNLDQATYVGEAGRLFYAQTTGTGHAPVLKYSDGSTPGGLPLSGGSLTFSSSNPPLNPSEGNLWWNTTDGRLYIYYDASWVDASPDITNTATDVTLTLLSVSTSTAVVGGALSYNNSTGIFTYRPADATRLVNGEYTVSLDSTGKLNFPNGNSSIRSAMGFDISSELGVVVQAVDASDPNNKIYSNWLFDTAGGIQFPDTSIQTTAFTGTATSLANGGPSVTVDNNGNLTVPGNVSSAGFITSGTIVIPNNGVAGGLISQNGQGNIYFETDNSLNFIITGTWQHVFNADGTITFGGGYIFPNTQGTQGQILVYDPAGNGDYKLSWQNQITAVSSLTNDIGYLTSSTVNTYTTAKNPFDQSLNTTDVVEFSGILPRTTSTVLGSLARPFKDLYLQSGSVNIANANNTLASLLVSNTDGFLELDGGGFRINHLGNPIFTVAAVTGQLFSEAKTIIANSANATSTTTGALQVAGGAGIQQDLWVGGTLNVNEVYSSGNLELYADTNGTVNVYGDYFHVHTTSNPNPVLQVAYDGQVTLRTPTFDATYGALNIIGSVDGSQVPTTNTGGMIHVTGQPGTPSRIYNDGSNSYAVYAGRRYNGTTTNPQPVLAGDSISRIGFTAYNGTSTNSGFAALGNGRIDFVAAEDQTPFANGAQIQFYTIVTGTNTIPVTPDLRIDSHGITFRDNTKQDTAAIPQTLFGTPNGVATLDGGGKIFTNQLPSGSVVFLGSWDANANSPVLSTNQMGAIAGWEYVTSTTGTQTISTVSGAVTFNPGDYVIYDGVSWNKIPGVVSVVSFNGRTGAVALTGTDVTSALGYTPYNATNPNSYITLAQVPTNVTSFNGRQNIVTLVTSDVTNVLTTGTITNNMLAGSIANGKLANSSITIGLQTVSLGGAFTTITNLITLSANDITASNFHGHLNGNADTASKLSPGVNINGVAFDGSSDIRIANTQTLTIGTGLSGSNYNGSAPSTITLNTATLMAQAISAQTATTATSAATAYSLANTSTTYVGRSSLADSATTSTSAATAYSLANTSTTYVGRSSLADSATTSTSAKIATTATNLAAATGILAGTFTVSPNVAKNSITTLTATITGLTTNHKIVITPQTVMVDNVSFFGAAYASAANTVSVQFSNGNGAVNATFTIAYFAWI